MKLSEHVYLLSGVPYTTNSNTYAIMTGSEIILIDAGYSIVQWKTMQQSLRSWGLDRYPVTHLFLTHVHFDHAGNAHLAKERGTRVLIGEEEADALETGNENTLKDYTEIFPETFIPCKVDQRIRPGEIFKIGSAVLEVISAKGHSAGALMFLVTIDDKRILFTGDNVTIGPDDAKDNILVNLAWMDGPDYSAKEYLKTLNRGAELNADILAPGHYYPYYGDVNRIFRTASRMLGKQLEEEKI